MALSATQYSSMKLTLRALLSGNRFATTPNLGELDLLGFWNQLNAEAAASGVALAASLNASIDFAFRSQICTAIARVPDTDWALFFTQLASDSSGAAALTANQYAALKLQLRGIMSAYSVLPGTMSNATLLGYLLPFAGVLGLVGTRTSVPDSPVANTQFWMQRFASFARDNITSLMVGWANWHSEETVPGVSVKTITASIEYPNGIMTQLKFSGSATGVAAAGTTIWTDMLTIPGGIPNGALFWVRFYEQNSVTFMGSTVRKLNTTLGDANFVGGADQTMSGTVTSNNNSMLTPCAIVGLTAKRTLAIIGDSREAGANETDVTKASGDYGQSADAFGGSYAYTNLAVSGKQSTDYIAAHALRDSILQYCTTVICGYGVNDIFIGGSSAATLKANLTTIRGYYPTKPFYVKTLDPETTSTDSWATLVNQTPRAQEAVRVAHNTAVRLDSLGLTGSFDYAAITESSLNSGLFKVDGTANKYTADGTHHTPFSYNLFVGAFALP